MKHFTSNILLRCISLGLVLGLLTGLCSCIRIEEPFPPSHPSTQKATVSAETQATTPPPPLPFDDPDTLADAFLSLPEGIVDCSRREYSYNQMCGDLALLVQAYPALFSYTSYGQSVLGRELYVCRLGNPQAKKQILVTAGLHGREYLTPILAMKQMEFMLTYASSGSFEGITYARMLEELCFYIVPMCNPDGIMLSQKGISSVTDPTAKSRIYDIYYSDFQAGLTGQDTINGYLQYFKANANGVDLNRNFDALWEQYYNYSKPSFAQFKGYTPADQPETQALMRLTDSLSNPLAVLCIHSQGEVLYWDCGQSGTLREETLALTRAIASLNGYRVITDANNDASFSDWCALKRGLIAITVETGVGLCPLDTEKFIPIWQDNYDLLAMTAAYFLD